VLGLEMKWFGWFLVIFAVFWVWGGKRIEASDGEVCGGWMRGMGLGSLTCNGARLSLLI
jgi:hypothetical protein